ncbi:hypothetical protein QLQ12_37880 [Actinoplanes sp. NEAU-A12]|uniref:Uncharacterized protein n=1 Tax=Actinoplanes sandaracinus TaxID=3045177 RepID=A0ABT6WXB9_9ACTN|nr:hypothetical protein [Actinoplanes sandaracinus]MDI6104377.1 hypothetical protein [Actinoplanes sandaracinus]
MTLINVSLVDGQPDDLYSLFDWLQRTDELRGHVKTQSRRPESHEMGGAVEVLSVALGSGGAGAVLISVLTTWLQARRARICIEVTHAESGEIIRRVEVDASSAAAVKDLYDSMNSDQTAR